jgi:predicted AlkP superfamily pyrophosphatase or phosphodiesterase
VLIRIALLLPLIASWASVASAQSSLILISIDGLRPDYVFDASKYGLRIPNLRSFVEKGTYAKAVHGVTPTVTYPSHTTILTGVAPAKHGFYSNTTFDPLNQNQQGWYWYAEDIKVPTLWSAAADAGLTTANVFWPVSVGAPVTYNLPQFWRSGTADDRKLLRAMGTPGLLAQLEEKLGPYADGKDENIEADENRGKFAAYLIQLKKPRFTTVYLTALDHLEHQHGPFSPEALAVLERIDTIVGSIRAASPASIVCVVSDHGFMKTTAEVNLAVPLVSAGFIQLDEHKAIRDWTAAMWPASASAAIVLKNPNDASVRDRVARLLRELASDPADGIRRIVDADELKKLGGFPGASFLVELAPGFQLGYQLSGPLVTATPVSGAHGYLPSSPEMNSTFFISGTGIPPGKSLGEIDMRSIAPTLANLLRLKWNASEAKDLFAR